MPQSSAASRLKAEALRFLRNPHAPVVTAGSLHRPVWAKRAFACKHGACVALDVHGDTLRVCVRTAEGEAWAPVARILSPDERRAWAREGFG